MGGRGPRREASPRAKMENGGWRMAETGEAFRKGLKCSRSGNNILERRWGAKIAATGPPDTVALLEKKNGGGGGS